MPKSSFYNYRSIKKKKAVNVFENISEVASKVLSSPMWFSISLLIVVVWLLSGFVIGFGEHWYIIFHTVTSVIIFLTMALLHASQKRWEERMIKMETHQERILEIMERETTEIKSSLLNEGTIETEKIDDADSVDEPAMISSLF